MPTLSSSSSSPPSPVVQPSSLIHFPLPSCFPYALPHLSRQNLTLSRYFSPARLPLLLFPVLSYPSLSLLSSPCLFSLHPPTVPVPPPLSPLSAPDPTLPFMSSSRPYFVPPSLFLLPPPPSLPPVPTSTS
jgi:hypothetical protein